MNTEKTGIIGGGNMGRAIAGGLLRGGMRATDLVIAEPSASQAERLRAELYGVQVADDNAFVAGAADVLLFAVKPQILRDVCLALAEPVSARRPLIISIAAGPRTADIDAWLGGGHAVVRAMPNQPALIDQGVSALYANERTSSEQRAVAERILGAVGQSVWLDDEDLIDGVTAVSGTGPAYFYLLIDLLIEAATRYGIDAGVARTLAVETARGAASLAAAETESMAALIERVRSPGGTTQAAFERLEEDDVRAIFSAAIDAARTRAIELARQANDSRTDET